MAKTPSLSTPRAVLFDAYGTLFDVYSVSALAEELYPGLGTAISQTWRDKQIEYTRLVTTSNHGVHYQPFWQLTRAGLQYAIHKHAINFIAAGALSTGSNGQLDLKNTGNFNATHAPSIEKLMAQYKQLSPFPENLSVLQNLKTKGVTTGVLSNGDMPMLSAVVESAGFSGLLDHVISVDPIRKYKTHPDAYALGEQATGLKAQDILFVSSNAWDALAATWYGYQTLWVNRAGLPCEEIGPLPTRVGSSLTDVLRAFD